MKLFRMFLMALVVIATPALAQEPYEKSAPLGFADYLNFMPRMFDVMEGRCFGSDAVRIAWCREDVSHIRKVRDEVAAIHVWLEKLRPDSKAALKLKRPLVEKLSELNVSINQWTKRYIEDVPSR